MLGLLQLGSEGFLQLLGVADAFMMYLWHVWWWMVVESLVLVVVTIFAGTKTVPQGQIWTVERFGAFTRELHPGLNFLIPYIDRIGRRLNV